MKKACQKSIAFLLLALGFISYTFSASLGLTHIGVLDISGTNWTEVWYTGTNFVLKGTADANASVSVKINDDTSTATADSSGNWSLSTTMGSGDHTVVITSGSESKTYTIHAGQNVPADLGTTTATTTDTSETTTGADITTGYSQILGIGLSVVLISYGLYMFVQGKLNKKAYSKSIIDSL